MMSLALPLLCFVLASPVPETPALWAARAQAALARGDELGAVEATQRSLALDPQQPALRRTLRRLDPDLAGAGAALG
ncbi:MAG: hypothetical protein H6702_13735 [Myxococcales bacterium]|nr:hypothetical protein [Myxococcales bacterium]